MKYRFTITLLVLGACVCAIFQAQANKKQAIPAVNVSYNKTTSLWCSPDGKPFTGVFKKHHANGKVSREATLVDGKQHGVVITWFENGMISSMETWDNGVIDGPMYRWLTNGRLHEVCNHKNGKMEGIYMCGYGPGKDPKDRRGSWQIDLYKNNKVHRRLRSVDQSYK